MNSGDLKIDIQNLKKGNLHGLDVDMNQHMTGADQGENALSLNYTGMGNFDKKIMKRILEDDMINV